MIAGLGAESGRFEEAAHLARCKEGCRGVLSESRLLAWWKMWLRVLSAVAAAASSSRRLGRRRHSDIVTVTVADIQGAEALL